MEDLDFTSAFFIALWYNGLEDDIYKLIEALRNASMNLFRPDWIKSDGSTDVLELLWMILVLKYGDYGTSPRSGWIDAENLAACEMFLVDMYEKHLNNGL